MTRATQAFVDLQALRHNFQRVREAAPRSRILAVVKANGYGHGLLRVAGALDGADAFGVANFDEAMALREAGVQAPVVILQGVHEPAQLEAAARHRLEIVVHHDSQLALLEGAPGSRPVGVWLKIDTGMHRLGVAPEAAPTAWRRLRDCPGVGDVRLMTHLSDADERCGAPTRRQLECFAGAAGDLPGERSIANSAAILAWPETHGQWVRPGLMLYGASPFNDSVAADEGLEPVMTLNTRLISVHRLKRGDRVGYGGEWACPEDMPVGVAAAGYGDGYPRHAPSGTPVLVNGRPAALIGRVSMDMICLDLRRVPDAQVNDPVTLWGAGLAVEEVARPRLDHRLRPAVRDLPAGAAGGLNVVGRPGFRGAAGALMS